MSRVGILGAGTWGMALARMLANSGHDVTVWSASEEEIEMLRTGRRHPKIPNVIFPETIKYSNKIMEACIHKDILLFAVPSVFVRTTVAKCSSFIGAEQIIVNVSKGIMEQIFRILFVL